MTDAEREALGRLIKALDGHNGSPGLREQVRDLWDEVYGSQRAGREGLVQWKAKMELRVLRLTAAVAGGVAVLSAVGALLQSLGAARTVRLLEAISNIQRSLP